MTKKIRIAVTDDQLLFRKGIISLLNEYSEINVAIEATNGKELLDILKIKTVDIILLDLEMPIMNGIETTQLVKEKFPEIKIIILTMHNEEEFVVELLKKGANGFILKDQDIEIVIDAIYSVTENGFYFNPTISEKLVKGLVKSNTISPTFKNAGLSPKEIEVIELICLQMTNKEIAEKLNLSFRTIDGYIEKIFAKTGVRNRAGIVMYAVKFNLVPKGSL